MKKILALATFLGLIAIGLAATSTGFYANSEHPGMCVLGPDQIYSPGSHSNVEGCAKIDCSRSGHADIYTCGVEEARPGCTLGDPVKPDAEYPACCIRRVICA